MKKTYHGSCHCGAIRFACDLDLAAGTNKCNCSICSKGRFWKAFAKADAFRLLQGEAALTEYTFASKTRHHFFCRQCGVKPFGRGSMEAFGGTFYAINLACLDDLDPTDLAEAPVIYTDGRHDNWQAPPAEFRHL
ncbi:MAG TPA: GFA family protein [Dongiaceae bacterium]